MVAQLFAWLYDCLHGSLTSCMIKRLIIGLVVCLLDDYMTILLVIGLFAWLYDCLYGCLTVFHDYMSINMVVWLVGWQYDC